MRETFIVAHSDTEKMPLLGDFTWCEVKCSRVARFGGETEQVDCFRVSHEDCPV